jgi:methyltransferase family protein
MAPDQLSTRIKTQLNVLLKPIGLRVGTTVAQRAEEARLNRLKAGGHWDKARYHQGLKLAPEKHLAFLSETCLPFNSSYAGFAQTANGNEQEFFLDNGYFRGVDAELLYSVIRKHRPHHVIEIGSGFSTRLVARAIKDGELETKLTSIDPLPRVSVDHSANEVIQRNVEDVDVEVITESLEAGDVLFIDSSHRVVTGGDVPYLFLEVVPRLKPGVLIHVHDVFFPFDYPEECVFQGWSWAEQYLVHAFLSFNDSFEILWPANYMWAFHRSDVRNVIPADPEIYPPSSLWLRRTH